MNKYTNRTQSRVNFGFPYKKWKRACQRTNFHKKHKDEIRIRKRKTKRSPFISNKHKSFVKTCRAHRIIRFRGEDFLGLETWRIVCVCRVRYKNMLTLKRFCGSAFCDWNLRCSDHEELQCGRQEITLDLLQPANKQTQVIMCGIPRRNNRTWPSFKIQ